jgi:hypothetical protein
LVEKAQSGRRPLRGAAFFFCLNGREKSNEGVVGIGSRHVVGIFISRR